RIAMKKDGVVSCIYGDQLGSVSAVADAGGNLISKTLYHPWGTPRYSDGISPTDYGYTGQMKEGDIYFYNARWYDPQLGRFMQADTIVPTVQGTQGFDRYAYVNNSPMKYTDPSGSSIYNPTSIVPDKEIVLIVSGSIGNIDETAIYRTGPNPLDQMTAWDWNPWNLPMEYVQYPGSKYSQFEDIKDVVETNVHTAVCYSAAPESCLMFVVDYQKNGMEVKNLILIGPTFTGSDTSDVKNDIGFDGWKVYLDTVLIGGTNVLAVDDLLPRSSENEILLSEYKAPEYAQGNYHYRASPFLHYDSRGRINTGSNNSRFASFLYYSWSILLSWE
ncbi:MAG: RHS repeat-associated core domain-containing protein, partial [Anaerolineaceae bacterium]